MEPEVGFLPLAVGFLPLLLIQIPYALFAGTLARRLNGNTVLWVILSLIPLVGMIFLFYVFYRIVSQVLDRLEEINSKTTF